MGECPNIGWWAGNWDAMKMTISKYGYKYWAVWGGGKLVAVTLYKRGALSIIDLVASLHERTGADVRSKENETKKYHLRKSPPNR
jgi:hypothetical protein